MLKSFRKKHKEGKRSSLFASLDPFSLDVPPIVRDSVAYIRERGLREKGVFRVPGWQTRVVELKKMYDKGEDVDLAQVKSVATIASLLKAFLAELPQPLVTFELMDCFMLSVDVIDLENDGQLAADDSASYTANLAAVRSCVRLLPPCHKVVLQHVVSLLVDISVNKEENGMGTENLAMCLAPAIVRREHPPSDINVFMEESKKGVKLIQTLIEDYRCIFGLDEDSISLQAVQTEDKRFRDSLRRGSVELASSLLRNTELALRELESKMKRDDENSYITISNRDERPKPPPRSKFKGSSNGARDGELAGQRESEENLPVTPKPPRRESDASRPWQAHTPLSASQGLTPLAKDHSPRILRRQDGHDSEEEHSADDISPHVSPARGRGENARGDAPARPVRREAPVRQKAPARSVSPSLGDSRRKVPGSTLSQSAALLHPTHGDGRDAKRPVVPLSSSSRLLSPQRWENRAQSPPPPALCVTAASDSLSHSSSTEDRLENLRRELDKAKRRSQQLKDSLQSSRDSTPCASPVASPGASKTTLIMPSAKLPLDAQSQAQIPVSDQEKASMRASLYALQSQRQNSPARSVSPSGEGKSHNAADDQMETAVQNLADYMLQGRMDEARLLLRQISSEMSGSRYEGSMRSGKPHGEGTFYFSNGDVYRGEFRDGMRHGHGLHRYANGDTYEGEFYRGKRHGYGVYVDKEGNNYKGQYLNGKRHGQGKQVTSQRTYEGQFKDGQPHGKGIQVFSNGDRYEGDFECDYPHGYGKFTGGNGGSYEGEYRHGFRHGHGVFISATGSSYKGYFKENLMEGEGTYLFASGDIYRGKFLAGKFEGSGKYTFADGKVIEGTFRNGECTDRV